MKTQPRIARLEVPGAIRPPDSLLASPWSSLLLVLTPESVALGDTVHALVSQWLDLDNHLGLTLGTTILPTPEGTAVMSSPQLLWIAYTSQPRTQLPSPSRLLSCMGLGQLAPLRAKA